MKKEKCIGLSYKCNCIFGAVEASNRVTKLNMVWLPAIFD